MVCMLLPTPTPLPEADLLLPKLQVTKGMKASEEGSTVSRKFTARSDGDVMPQRAAVTLTTTTNTRGPQLCVERGIPNCHGGTR